MCKNEVIKFETYKIIEGLRIGLFSLITDLNHHIIELCESSKL